jgi:hypothetical protein
MGLAATGNTLNIMTLGGLSLAVGILVDDATVTIENINRHLEQGQGVRQAILEGAREIVTPAFVSLLCICIVFVPMFFLPRVAGFLFVPLALSVVVRDDRVVRPVLHPGADHGPVPAPAARRGVVPRSRGRGQGGPRCGSSSAASSRPSSASARATPACSSGPSARPGPSPWPSWP